MDKNKLIGFVLIALVLIGFSWWTRPSEEDAARRQAQDSLAAAARMEAERRYKSDSIAAVERARNDTSVLFHSAMRGKAEDVVLSNRKVELTLGTKGGTVTKAVIKGYRDIDGNPDVTLFDSRDQALRFFLEGKETNISTGEMYFKATNVTDSTVTMTADAGAGRTLELDYRLGADYMLHMSVRATGMAGIFPANCDRMAIDWSDRCRQQERGFTFENRYSTLTYHFTDGGTDYINAASDKTDKEIDKVIDWVAFKNQFFSAMMIAEGDLGEKSLMTSLSQEKGSGYLKKYEAKVCAFFDPTGVRPTRLEFYYGPNDFRLLQRVERESEFGKPLQMQRLVYLGWPLFRIINRWFTLYVFDILTGLNIRMGIVLILITLLLKVITFPLVKRSYMSSAKMRVLKPKLEEATKQYDKPEDQMKKQQEMMALYSKYGVSPLSGCLPMLIQMPIWIAMFNFVPNAIQLRGESFLWIKDLSTYDPIIEWNRNIWLIGDHLSLTCILFCVSNVLYSMMSMRQQKDQMVGQQAEQMKMMQWMMYLLPVMFFFMFNDYSAGLNFYYFISLFFSAAIMWILRRTTNDERLLSRLERNYRENKNNPQKVSGLAARLESMQRQAEEMKRAREEQMNGRMRPRK